MGYGSSSSIASAECSHYGLTDEESEVVRWARGQRREGVVGMSLVDSGRCGLSRT